MQNLNEAKSQDDITEISDPLGKFIVSPRQPGSRPFSTPYTAKSARWYGGYGAGLLGKMQSEGDPNATPLEITEDDLKRWNAFQRFAYKNHTIFFSLGTLFFIAGIGGIYLLTTINIFYASAAFFPLMILIWYFAQTLFLIEGQSIPGSEYKLFPTIKDVVDDESIYIDRKGNVISKESIDDRSV